MTTAVAITDFGIPPQLIEVPEPTAGAGEVVIRVQASSVNSLDGGIAAGMFAQMLPHELPVTLGADFAGTVEAVGDGATTVAVGDTVFGEVPQLAPPVHDGAWAQRIAVSEKLLTRVPAGVDLAAAGAAGLVGITALLTVDPLDLAPGKTVLVVGATGGVGSVVVQLARVAGAKVIAPALPEDEHFLRDLGVDEVVPRDGDVVAAVRQRHPEGVNALVDLVTAYRLTEYEGALAADGRVASPTNAAGEGAGRTNVMHAPTSELLDRLAQHLADGTVRIPIQQTFDFTQAAEALQTFSGGHTLGKIAIRVS